MEKLIFLNLFKFEVLSPKVWLKLVFWFWWKWVTLIQLSMYFHYFAYHQYTALLWKRDILSLVLAQRQTFGINIRSDCSFVKNLTKEVRAIYRPFGCNLLNSDPVSWLELEPSLRWMSVGTEHRTYSNPCTGNGNTSIQLQDSQAE